MALGNNALKSTNSPLTIFSLSLAVTGGKETAGVWVLLSNKVAVLPCGFPFAISLVAVGGLTGGFSEATDNTSAESSFGLES